jgi:hypothetical protein
MLRVPAGPGERQVRAASLVSITSNEVSGMKSCLAHGPIVFRVAQSIRVYTHAYGDLSPAWAQSQTGSSKFPKHRHSLRDRLGLERAPVERPEDYRPVFSHFLSIRHCFLALPDRVGSMRARHELLFPLLKLSPFYHYFHIISYPLHSSTTHKNHHPLIIIIYLNFPTTNLFSFSILYSSYRSQLFFFFNLFFHSFLHSLIHIPLLIDATH